MPACRFARNSVGLFVIVALSLQTVATPVARGQNTLSDYTSQVFTPDGDIAEFINVAGDGQAFFETNGGDPDFGDILSTADLATGVYVGLDDSPPPPDTFAPGPSGFFDRPGAIDVLPVPTGFNLSRVFVSYNRQLDAYFIALDISAPGPLDQLNGTQPVAFDVDGDGDVGTITEFTMDCPVLTEFPSQGQDVYRILLDLDQDTLNDVRVTLVETQSFSLPPGAVQLTGSLPGINRFLRIEPLGVAVADLTAFANLHLDSDNDGVADAGVVGVGADVEFMISNVTKGSAASDPFLTENVTPCCTDFAAFVDSDEDSCLGGGAEDSAGLTVSFNCPDIEVSKQVRCLLPGNDTFEASLSALPGATVQYEISTQNWGNRALAIDLLDQRMCIPPAAATLIPGSCSAVGNVPAGVDEAEFCAEFEAEFADMAAGGPELAIGTLQPADACVTGAGESFTFRFLIQLSDDSDPALCDAMIDCLNAVSVIGTTTPEDNPLPDDQEEPPGVADEYAATTTDVAGTIDTPRETSAGADNNVASVEIDCRASTFEKLVRVVGEPDFASSIGLPDDMFPLDIEYLYRFTNNGELSETVVIEDAQLCTDVTNSPDVSFGACTLCTDAPAGSATITVDPGMTGAVSCTISFASRDGLLDFLTIDDDRPDCSAAPINGNTDLQAGGIGLSSRNRLREITVGLVEEDPNGVPSLGVDGDPCAYRNCGTATARIINQDTCAPEETAQQLVSTAVISTAGDPPVAIIDLCTTGFECPRESITCDLDGSQSTGGGLEYTWTTTCAGGVFSPSDKVASPTLTFMPDFDCGTCSVMLVVSNCGGDSPVATATIEVFDDEPPVLTCDPGELVRCFGDVPPADINSCSVTDNCPGEVTIEHVGDVMTGDGCPGEIIRTYQATDGCGNTDEYVVTYFVSDEDPPMITCPEGGLYNCLEDVPPLDANSCSVTDNCPGTGDPVCVETIIGDGCPATVRRTCTVTDSCGNTAVFVQDNFVNDDVPPVLTCDPGELVRCFGDVPPADINSCSVTDNCPGEATIEHVGDVMEGDGCPGEIIRTYQATDRCGNTDQFVVTYFVSDEEAPMITCPEGGSYDCLENVPPLDPASCSVTDNCPGTGDPVCVETIIGDGCPATVRRTCTVTDSCGNTAVFVQDNFVNDDVPPDLTCDPGELVRCFGDVPPADINSCSVTDNCSNGVTIVHVGDVMEGDGCPGEIIRTYRATDRCGNTDEYVVTYFVSDEAPPMITCPEGGSYDCLENVPPLDPASCSVTDNCPGTGDPVCVETIIGDGCPATVRRTCTVTDSCGNTAVFVQDNFVNDDVPPDLTCDPGELVRCFGDVPPADINNCSATDNCSNGVTIIHVGDMMEGDGCPGEIIRTYRATDRCGNTDEYVVTYFVSDEAPPMITCPEGGSYDCLENVPPLDPASCSVTDNCPGTGDPVCVETIIGDGCPATVRRTCTVTDSCGNTAVFVQDNFVNDDVPPELTCDPGELVRCFGDVPPADINNCSATDNCSNGVTIIHVGDMMEGDGCPGEIIRTYRATDRCGNTDEYVVTYFVSDEEAPMITCPEGGSYDCLENVPPLDPASCSVTDNCPGTGDPVCVETIIGDGCPATVRRTCTVTDSCGNTAVFVQDNFVNDDVPPDLTCDPGELVRCFGDVPPADINSCSVTDNCSNGVTIVHVGDVMEGDGCPGEIIRTYRATDRCGNTDEYVVTYFVSDEAPPMITCPEGGSYDCLENVPPLDPASCSVTDNCPGTGDPVCVETIIGDGCPATVRRTCTVTDSCGNTAVFVQDNFVNDDVPPDLTCDPGELVRCFGDVPPADINNCSATDNCSNGVTIIHVGDMMEGDGCPGEIIRTYRATDRCGNTDEYVVTYFVSDEAPPMITCPEGGSYDCLENVPPLDPASCSVTDNCPGTGDPVCVETIIGDGCPATVRRTCTVTDSCGNTAVFVQDNFVNDDVPPELTCDPGELVRCFGDVPPADINNCSATDNCSNGVTIIHVGDMMEGDGCPGEIIRTYRATDRCGNTDEYVVTYFVSDEAPPMITCPEGGSYDCLENVPPLDPASCSVTDNCPGTGDPVCVETIIGDGCPATVRRTCTVTDSCGNTAVFVQDNFVNDDVPPELTCDPGTMVRCFDDVPPADINSCSVTDNCSNGAIITHVGDMMEGDGCPGTVVRTYRATDRCGNTAEFEVRFPVNDGEPPTITCPEGGLYDCLENVPPLDANSCSVTDNCPAVGAPVCVEEVIGDGCPATVRRTCTVTDTCGNTAVFVQENFVDDDQPPMLTCPMGGMVDCPEDIPPANTNGCTATDNCVGEVAIRLIDEMVMSNGCITTVIRTYEATDRCGNTDTAEEIWVARDDEPPMIDCPDGGMYQCFDEVPPFDVNSCSVSDNCDGPVTVACSDETIGDGCPGQLIRTCVATDACGNTSAFVQVNEIDDTTAPELTCPPTETVECLSDVPGFNTAGVMVVDNCDVDPDIDPRSIVDDGMTCPTMVRIGYFTIDDCGNSDKCAQTIIVDDQTPPMITCPADITVDCLDNVPDPSTNGVTVTDNCGGPVRVSFGFDNVTGDDCNGEVVRTYMALDECNNRAFCIQTITVQDEEPPTIDCPDGEEVDCFDDLPPADLNGCTASDNCDEDVAIELVGDELIGNACDGEVVRTFVATDDCGNTSTDEQRFPVRDETPPTITCPPVEGVECLDDLPPADVAACTATDNCDDDVDVSLIRDELIGDACDGEVVRVYLATDDCGNTAVFEQRIPVADETPPMITCPPVDGVECLDDVPPADVAACTATDNCDDDVAVDLILDELVGDPCDGEVVRVYLATDDCGNTAVFEQRIPVADETPPMITCPPVNGVECLDDLPRADIAACTATDNCDDDVAVDLIRDELVGDPCDGEVVRVYLATDDCGNTAVFEQRIPVADETPPMITCLPVDGVECLDDLPPADLATCTASDNCDDDVTIDLVRDELVGVPCDGEVVRVYLATDDCGNTAVVEQRIRVLDDQDPTLRDLTATGGLVDADCVATVDFSFVVEDNCCVTTDGISLDVTAVNDGASLGPVTCDFTTNAGRQIGATCSVTIRDLVDCPATIDIDVEVTDCCNNGPATASTSAVVSDNLPPTVTCPADMLLPCDGTPPPCDEDGVLEASTDNCGVVEVTCSDEGEINEIIVRTYTAVDACGNTDTCEQRFTFEDCCDLSIEAEACVVQLPPKPMPWECDKPIDVLTMIWDGTQPVRIKAYKGSVGSELLADIDNIQVGDEVSVSGFSGSPNDVFWEVFVAGTSTKLGESKFHLSCSDSEMNGPEDCGLRQGNGKSNESNLINDWLLEGILDVGGELDCTPDVDPNTNGVCISELPLFPPLPHCDGKVTAIEFRYTGASCDATANSQDASKQSCSGDPMGADPVFIRVNDDETPSDTSRVYFEGLVDSNGVLTATAVNAGETQFSSATFAHIFDETGTTLLQTLEFHTSCSQPLNLSDVFGSLEIVGLSTTEGGSIRTGGEVVVTYRVTNQATAETTDIVVTDDCFGVIESCSTNALAPGATLECSTTAFLDSDKMSTVTVTGDPGDPDCNSTGFWFVTQQDPPEKSQDCCENGNPRLLRMLYTGESCSATSTSQDPDKVDCSGDPMFAQRVFIRSTDKSDPLDESGKIWFVGTVGLNETYDLDARNSGETRFSSNTYIHIFDVTGTTLLQTVKFHTSCSQPLFVNDQYGANLIIDCFSENDPIPGDCCANGKPRVLTMKYTGDDCLATNHQQDPGKVNCAGDPNDAPLVRIIASEKENPTDGLVWFDGTVALGAEFDIDAMNAGEDKLKSVTFVQIRSLNGNLLQSIEFHTSCSQPLAVGNQFGAVLLVGCQSENDPIPGAFCVDGAKPQQLVMTYTGDNCDASDNSQSPDKFSCSGDVNGADPVRVRASNKENPNDGGARVYFDGMVDLNDPFTVDATAAGQNRLESATFLHFFSAGGQLLQTVEFHTSCSQPLNQDDQFGAARLDAFIPEP